MKITYFGIIRSITSWSKIARNIILSLIKTGIEVNVYERKGFLYDSNFEIENEIKERINNKFDGDVILTFEHPKNYIYLPENKIKVGFLVYEFTSLPEIWVRNINRYLDMVFVPSKFTYKVFVDSGVDRSKLKVLRYGIDPEIYYPVENKVLNELVFLSIASPHKREGVDILLESFYKAFNNISNVKLILKLSYMTYGNEKSFEIKNFNRLIENYKKLLGDKLYITYKKMSEYEIAELYRKSNVYFSLSKAESFGLCFLESIASNRPVIALNYSGQSDFLNETNSYFVDYRIVETEGEEYDDTEVKQFISCPSMESAVEKLSEVYTGKNNLKQTSVSSHYYWDTIVRELLFSIKTYIRS